MKLCEECNIVYAYRSYCPLCSLREHNNEVHDFIESKGKELVNELVAYQQEHNNESSKVEV